MVLSQYSSALKMRDVIRRLARQVVNIERPPDKLGRVVDVDRGGGIAKVVYAGDETTQLRVAMYPGLQPLKCDRIDGEGLGSIVRVSGAVGSRYISEILSDAPFMLSPKLSNPRFAGGGDAESSLVSEIGVKVVAPAASSTVQVGVLTVPNRAANITINCELIGATDSYIQSGRIITDWTTAQSSTLTGTTDATSSASMNLTFTYSVTADQLTVSLTRGTGARSFTTANVMMRCVGTDITLNASPDSGA
jgi:hypothetical protein